MKILISIFTSILFLWSCQSENKADSHDHSRYSANQIVSDTSKGSPKRTVMANIGKTHIHIEYNSPAVRNRIIWGGLVPLGEVWVTGAHNATSISFSDNVKIEGKIIEKGKYAFFTIPNKEEWALILNKNWEQHLTDDYSEKDDILRWKVKPDSTEYMERLMYDIISKGEKGTVEMRWEKVKISFEIESL